MRTEAVSLSALTNDMQTASHALENLPATPSVNPETWVDDHGDCLFRYAFSRLRDETLAEDIVQETLLSAIQSLNSYGGRSTERTWLTGILKHKIIDHYRKNSKNVQFTEDDTDLSVTDHFFERPDAWDGHWVIKLRPVDPEQSPEQVVERGEFWDVMNTCLSALPERVASVFTLREVDGLTSDEICEVLSLSPSNFWVIMHRARMQLRRCVEIKWFRKVI
ncbi:MAG: sigma-70 family RNA polymerase sigma factor [Pyrinomonadaceae bacterium]